LAEVVASLPAGERAAIQRALRTLREEFQSVAARDELVTVG
jgi:predicted PP-loop superfamily ATPase